ncbi:putative Ig domain-containing protein [Vulcaniibacterium tengchongense]|uniref:putative Ig domain-containing protein n=1 Tax=Vulcaniibacterium tengchongense TaxID=1273429 RepID=UPI000F5123E5|nr:putative Ig domain-containing protein [Vulcaniibacterium tengchongense]
MLCVAFGLAGPAWAVCPSPQTATVASGGSATFNCSVWGFEFPVPTAAHGAIHYSGATLVYTNNGDGATSDTFQAVNSDDGATVTFNITVQPPTSAITVSPATLPAPRAGVAYGQTLTASGGAGPYSYSWSGNPAGLSLSAGGQITGTPTASGIHTITVAVTDSSATPETATKTYTVDVQPPQLSFNNTGLAAGYVGATYSHTFVGSGGTEDYTFSLDSGSLPPGLSITADDRLAGTPTTAGTYTFRVRMDDATTISTGGDHFIARDVTLVVNAIAITPTTLPGGVAYVPYSQSLTASGGTGSYAFSLASGTLPAGLSLSSGGTLSGTPTAVGAYHFTVRATDSGSGAFAEQAYAVAIAAPTIALSPSALPDGTAGVAYSQAFSASGGSGPYSFSLVSGGLPVGMSLSSAGALSGTPAAAGRYNFTVRATDANGFSGDRAYALTVAAATIVLSPATLPDATAGIAYGQAFSASGGSGSYSFSLVSGGLPVGMSLSSAGALSGTPSVAGAYNFTVRATDANGSTGDRAYSLTVVAPIVAVSPASLPNGTLGVAYSQTFTGSGGTAPYTFSLVSGGLPVGMSLSSAGALSGMPAAAGRYNFTVRATDANGFSGDRAYALTVAAATIVLSPATLPDATAGIAYGQTFSASGGSGPYSFSLVSGTLPAGLSLSGTGALAGTPTLPGSYGFTVRAQDGFGSEATRNYALVVRAAVPVAADDGASVYAGQSVTVEVVGNDTGDIGAVTLVAAPGHGSVAPSGLAFVYTAAAGYAGSDSFTYTASGPGGTSNVATVTVTVAPLPVPVGAAQSVTTVAGQAVSFDAASGASSGPFTGLGILAAPAEGTLQVSGTTITYLPPATASGSVTVRYTLNNGFGPSAPIVSTIAVQPRPVAVAHQLSTTMGVPVAVDLTTGASGGPFTAAAVVSLTPANAGSATIQSTGSGAGQGFRLAFAPAAGFVGAAEVRYTLSNAYATSAPAAVAVQVADRGDPSDDPDVQGLLAAQSEAAKRLAAGQIGNLQSRMERLHRGDGGGFDNRLTFSFGTPCPQGRPSSPAQACAQRRDDEDAAVAPQAAPAASGGGAFGAWIAGSVRSGDLDARRGGSDALDFETSGVTLGVDRRFAPGFVAGVGVGYGRDSTDVGERGARSKARASSLALYASHRAGEAFFLDGLLGYQWLSFDSRRHVDANGARVYGERDGSQWFASLAASYEHRDERKTVAPYLRFDRARATLDAFTERGDPIHALHYGEQKIDVATGNLGLRLEFHHRVGGGLLSPLLRLEYQHDFDDNGAVTLNYADLLSGPFYRVQVPGQERNRFVFGAGLMLQAERDWTLRAEYRGLVDADRQSEHAILLNVEKEF